MHAAIGAAGSNDSGRSIRQAGKRGLEISLHGSHARLRLPPEEPGAVVVQRQLDPALGR